MRPAASGSGGWPRSGAASAGTGGPSPWPPRPGTPPRCAGRAGAGHGDGQQLGIGAGRGRSRTRRDRDRAGEHQVVGTDLGSRLVRAWGIVPAAVSERDVGSDLLQTGPPPRDLLVDKGFNGKAFAACQAARGTAVLLPPAKGQRHRMPAILRKIIAEWRNRIETTFQEITGQMELARHGAHTFCGLLT